MASHILYKMLSFYNKKTDLINKSHESCFRKMVYIWCFVFAINVVDMCVVRAADKEIIVASLVYYYKFIYTYKINGSTDYIKICDAHYDHLLYLIDT